VMTSNLGSHLIQDMAAKVSYEQLKEAVMGVVTEHFRPEFINRIDEITVFHPLSKEQIVRIAEIQIHYVAERLKSRDIILEVDNEAMDLLGAEGFDPVYGARPLKRTIQQQLENPLAQRILRGDLKSGDTIQVSCEKGELVFR